MKKTLLTLSIMLIFLILFLTSCDFSLNSYITYESNGIMYKMDPITLTCSVVGIGDFTGETLIINKYVNGYKVIGVDDLGCDIQENYSLKNIILPNSIKYIDDGAFIGCQALTKINIPDGVTRIGDCAFLDCNSLKNITIPDSVTYIGDGAFLGCTSLVSAVLPEHITTIGKGTFSNCHSLVNIVIPDSVTIISGWAFNNCNSLAEIKISEHVTYIGAGAFAQCNNLVNIEVKENNNTYKSVNGNLYSKDGTFLKQYAIGKNDTDFIIPVDVKTVSSWAFFGNSSLSRIVLPNDITTIEAYAFIGCESLVNIAITENVTYIGEGAFADCSKLKNIEVDEKNREYKSVEGNLYNKELTTLMQYALGKNETNFRIPDTVTSIGSNAFGFYYSIFRISYDRYEIVSNICIECPSITNITLPNGIKNINDNSFNKCPRLKNIYYIGTEEQWKNITIGSNNDVFLEATIIYEYVDEE